jgi:peptidoglycan hydrolase-like protein with peptidoglycan-binding domain
MRKIIVGLVLAGALLGAVPFARASTLDDLALLVQQLREEVVQLKNQLQAASIRATTTETVSRIPDPQTTSVLETKVITPAKLGDSSEAVKVIQTELKTKGYYPGPITGVYGKETAKAVASLQKTAGISGDGSRVGSQTIAAITGGVSPAQIPNGGQQSAQGPNGTQSSIFGKVLVLAGGYWGATPQSFNDVWASSGTLTTWTEVLGDTPTPGVSQFSQQTDTYAVFHNGKIYLLGGLGGTGQSFYGDVWSSSNNGQTWTRLTTNAPWSSPYPCCGRRYGPGFVSFNGKLWIIGGDQNPGPNPTTTDIWSSPDGINWTQETSSVPWGRRHEHTTLVFNNKLWVIGGVQLQPYATKNDVWSSSDGVTWTQVTTNAPWSPRNGHMSVVFNNKMWVIGGGGFNSDVWSSSDGINWTQVTGSAPWGASFGKTWGQAIVYNNKIWILGGGGNSQTQASESEIWSSPDGATWTLVTNIPGWAGRSWHAAVVIPPSVSSIPVTNLPTPVNSACSANPVITVTPIPPAAQVVTQGQSGVQIADVTIKNYSSCTYKIRSVFPTYGVDAGSGNSSLLQQFTSQFILPTVLTYSVNNMVVGQGSISAGGTTAGVPLSLGIAPNSTKTIKVTATFPSVTGYSGFKLQPKAVKWMNVDLSGQIFQVTPQTNYTNATWFTVQ